MSQGTINNRRTPRRVFERLVGLLYKGRYLVCNARQISEGGMMLVTDFPLKPQDHTVIAIILPDGGHAVLIAEVLYQRDVQINGKSKPGYGFKFLNLPFQTRRLIRNYVAAKTQAEAENDLMRSEAKKAA